MNDSISITKIISLIELFSFIDQRVGLHNVFFIFAHLRTPSVAFTDKWLPKSKKNSSISSISKRSRFQEIAVYISNSSTAIPRKYRRF